MVTAIAQMCGFHTRRGKNSHHVKGDTSSGNQWKTYEANDARFEEFIPAFPDEESEEVDEDDIPEGTHISFGLEQQARSDGRLVPAYIEATILQLKQETKTAVWAGQCELGKRALMYTST